MGHIHNNIGEHDQTVSAFIVRTDLGDEPRLMLHMHKKLGKLLQVGGHIELNENPWQAIHHELLEESGYDLNQLQILQPKQFRIKTLDYVTVHPIPIVQSTHGFEIWPGHYHTDTTYAFVANSDPNNEPVDGESQDIRWVTYKELCAVPENEIIDNIREIGKLVLTVFLKEWEQVPSDEFPVVNVKPKWSLG